MLRRIVSTLLVAALLSAYTVMPAFANDAHHPPTQPPPGSTDTTTPVLPSEIATSVPIVGRYATGDRYAASLAVSRQSFAAGSVRNAVVVSGNAYADGLAASSLAGSYRSPVLLTRPTGPAPDLIAELRRLGAKTVHIVGPASAVSSRVASALARTGFKVHRITGATSIATAAAVARAMAAVRGASFTRKALVVNINDLFNAVSASGYAYAAGVPILYVTARSVPGDTARALKSLRIRSTVVVGGTGSVYSSTFKSVSARTSQEDTRVSGADRFEVAHALADFAIEAGWAKPDHATIVNGITGFATGVVAAAFTGSSRGVTLLATADVLPYYSDHFVASRSRKMQIHMVAVVGGPSTLSDAVLRDAATSASGGDMDMTLMMPMDPDAPMMMPMASSPTTPSVDTTMPTPSVPMAPSAESTIPLESTAVDRAATG